MSQTLSQAEPSVSKPAPGIFPRPVRLLVFTLFALAPISLAVAAPGDTISVDTSTVAVSADSTYTDSTSPAGAADSVIQRLSRSRSGDKAGEPLDLTLEKPTNVFSARNISMVLIVIGLLVLFMHFLRKYLFKPVGGGISGGQFQVVRQFHLGPRKSVALVRFADRLLLLGVTDSNINTLAEIDDPEEVEKIISDTAKSGENPGGAFKDIYHNLLSRSGKGKN